MADSVRASTPGLEIVEQARLRRGWNKYADIWCQAAHTSKATLKRFWRREPIHKETFIKICEAVGLTNWKDIVDRYVKSTELDPDFVGRSEAIAQLHNMVNQAAKIIVIQGEGGVGKTRLARKYFETQGFKFLELSMATEPQNIISVESVVEEWLWRDFDEQPGRTLGINLQRLKRKLRDEMRRTRILIDNLETALDINGTFIHPHRHYVELLRVLADPAINSVTLITSRERLCEVSVDVNFYMLKGLEQSAWRQFFASRNINPNPDSTALREICRAYGGNAKAMRIISGVICADFECDIDAYWNVTHDDLLIEQELENLVVSQFNRLQEIDPEAYRLLCRLGCYRYQDVPRVPIDGLVCLLWDVPESQRRRVVNSLRARSLVECRQGEYWLHPVILTEAIARLRLSGEWETANRKAADFWTNSVNTVQGTKDALTALEAYYHYVVIEDFEQAADVIIRQRNNKWGTHESLGRSFYKRGLLKPMTAAITEILNKVNPGYRLAKLYHTLGAICWLKGDIHQAVDYCKQSREIALTCLQSIGQEDDNETVKKLQLIVINSFLTIGICQIGCWELEEAVNTLTQVVELCEKLDYEKYAPSALFYLAFLNSCLGRKEEASEIANYLYNRLPEEGLPSWVTEYRLFYLSLTFKNLGEIEKSFKIYQKDIFYAEKSPYTQAKTKALIGLAQLYREQENFEEAVACHEKAIKVLGEIGAKWDLAEAYFQLALTYQRMREVVKSRENFEKAIALFNEMQAPKQVEKVQKAMESL
ncbi:tetratricopeptide repeat protein [Scytonema sp. PCC 10023]|uniref:tetratricopeptide repeat protein n=1 Tax=Scytonema sp. PCC 10023 TaxID=1680591 RepID=UPI0039C71BFC